MTVTEKESAPEPEILTENEKSPEPEVMTQKEKDLEAKTPEVVSEDNDKKEVEPSQSQPVSKIRPLSEISFDPEAEQAPESKVW